MDRQQFCDSGSVRGKGAAPPSQAGWAGWADRYPGPGLEGLLIWGTDRRTDRRDQGTDCCTDR